MSNTSDELRFGAFLPLLLMGGALCIFFTWQLVITVQVRANTKRITEQQSELVIQSIQGEERMKRMMLDLIALAETDEEAAEIVQKFNIAFTPPSQQPLNLGSGTNAAPSSAAGPVLPAVPEAAEVIPEAAAPAE